MSKLKPYYGPKNGITIYGGDCRKVLRGLEPESVQCIITSPPYWGLRKYAGEQELVWGGVKGCEHNWKNEDSKSMSGGGSAKQRSVRGSHFDPGTCGTCGTCGAWRGAFGLEPKISMYIEHTVTILRELRRVLRKDGVLFWNVGDSYSSGGRNSTVKDSLRNNNAKDSTAMRPNVTDEIKPKDLCLIPSRVAIAAQSDGWYVRSMIIWSKPNPMPESVTDRPTDAYEHIIMLTKSSKYFWDADSVCEPASVGYRGIDFMPTSEKDKQSFGREKATGASMNNRTRDVRNVRNVWTFPTQPYSEAHFAGFPEKLPRLCILAATSEKGACAKCGTPWERVTKTSRSGNPLSHVGDTKNAAMYVVEGNQLGPGVVRGSETIGWRPTCSCRGQHAVPCIVLDPFVGSGTVCRVAKALSRDAIGIDLAPSYCEMAVSRFARCKTARKLVSKGFKGLFEL
jgi:DNA modification methylase